MHEFVDPDLKRVPATWDDVEVPARLRELAEETWRGLSKLAEPGGDTPDVHELLDEVRAAYVELYDEAEAIAQSSAVAARREGRQQALDGGRPAPVRASPCAGPAAIHEAGPVSRPPESRRVPDPLALAGRVRSRPG